MHHPALNQLYEILRRAHKHVLKPPRLHSAVLSPSRVAFQNPKAIRDKPVRFKNLFIKMLGPIFVVILTVICVKYLKVEMSLKVTEKKNTELIFHLIATVVALFIHCHAKYVLNST